MASALALSSSSPFLSNKAFSSAKANVIAPPSASFPSRRHGLPAVRAQAGGDGNVDVAVNQGSNQGTQVEKRPSARRLAVDVSPFGKWITSTKLNFLFHSLNFENDIG